MVFRVAGAGGIEKADFALVHIKQVYETRPGKERHCKRMPRGRACCVALTSAAYKYYYKPTAVRKARGSRGG
jgi:hypothetical protein